MVVKVPIKFLFSFSFLLFPLALSALSLEEGDFGSSSSEIYENGFCAEMTTEDQVFSSEFEEGAECV